jgi:hypothetical protein
MGQPLLYLVEVEFVRELGELYNPEEEMAFP